MNTSCGFHCIILGGFLGIYSGISPEVVLGILKKIVQYSCANFFCGIIQNFDLGIHPGVPEEYTKKTCGRLSKKKLLTGFYKELQNTWRNLEPDLLTHVFLQDCIWSYKRY